MGKKIKEREEYIDGLVKKLTLDEKIGMIHGAGLFRTAGVSWRRKKSVITRM